MSRWRQEWVDAGDPPADDPSADLEVEALRHAPQLDVAYSIARGGPDPYRSRGGPDAPPVTP